MVEENEKKTVAVSQGERIVMLVVDFLTDDRRTVAECGLPTVGCLMHILQLFTILNKLLKIRVKHGADRFIDRI